MRNWWVSPYACLVAAAMTGSTASGVVGQATTRQLAVSVLLQPTRAVFDVGEPILIEVVVRNDLSAPIRFTTFSLQPNEWNGETAGVELVSVRRLPDSAQIWRGRPSVQPPMHVAGQGSYPVPAGGQASRWIDLSKWTVDGGWNAGDYEVSVRVDAIQLDEHAVASVTSELVEVRVRAMHHAADPVYAAPETGRPGPRSDGGLGPSAVTSAPKLRTNRTDGYRFPT
jgi:hypothetical protein